MPHPRHACPGEMADPVPPGCLLPARGGVYLKHIQGTEECGPLKVAAPHPDRDAPTCGQGNNQAHANDHLSASMRPAGWCPPPRARGSRPWPRPLPALPLLGCTAAIAQCLGQSPVLALPGEALPMKLGLRDSLSPHPDNTQKLRSLVISLTSQRSTSQLPNSVKQPLKGQHNPAY